MIQRRPYRTAFRSRSLALGGVLAAVAVVGGGTVLAVNAPADVDGGDIRLAQNAAPSSPQTMPLGTAVNLDLEPVVARAAGGSIPEGTSVQVTGLPDGLTQSGWVISGTPTRAGEYDVLVTVSNSGVSRSQKVTIVVTDEAGQGGATSTPADESAPGAGVEPTLTATPGDRARAGASQEQDPGEEGGGTGDAGDGTSDDDEATTGPDLCAVLGDGQIDGASLAQLLPTGGDDASSGLVLVVANAILGLLPSVLGESGLLDGLGSAGRVLCTLSPSLLGSQGADTVEGEAGASTTASQPDGAQGQGADAVSTLAPALLGLLTTGAGSLGE